MELIGAELKPETESTVLLKQFQVSNSSTKSFDYKLEDRRKVWESLYKIIKHGEADLQYEALNCARILSRDSNGINEVVSDDLTLTLLRLGHIETGVTSQDDKVNVESLKVLSNLMHGSRQVQSYCAQFGFLSKLLDKISSYSSLPSSNDAKIFDCRLLFLFTALLPEQRNIARHNLDAVNILLGVLQTVLAAPEVGQEDGSVVCEVLKVLFNISVNSTQEDTEELRAIARRCRDLVRMKIADSETSQKVVSNVMNVVTNMEGRLEPLHDLLETSELGQPAEQDVTSHGVVVNVLESFLQLLQHK